MLICGCVAPYISPDACKNCNIYKEYWSKNPPLDEESLKAIEDFLKNKDKKNIKLK